MTFYKRTQQNSEGRLSRERGWQWAKSFLFKVSSVTSEVFYGVQKGTVNRFIHLSVYFCRMIRYTFEKDRFTSNINILRVLPQVDKSNGTKSSDLQIFTVSHFSINQSRSRVRDSLSRLRARQFWA